MLNFAAIVPSSPHLLRAREDAQAKSLWPQTLAGLDALTRNAKTAALDYGILISHLLLRDDRFGINASPRLRCDLREYGEIREQEYAGSPQAAIELLRSCDFLASASSEKSVNSAHAVALGLLSTLPHTAVLPIFIKRGASPQECARFGHMLCQGILQSSKRYGVVALGDCAASRALDPQTDTPMNQFAQDIMPALSRKAVSKLIDYAAKHEQEWRDTSLPAILILASVVSELSCQFQYYAYENPLGAGQLTAQYIL